MRFGPYELDPAGRRLTRGEARILLQPQQFEVLVQLVAHQGRFVTKDALAETAWAGVAITDNTIQKAISRLRDTLGPQPDGSPYVESAARLGYRFAAIVERVAGDAAAAPAFTPEDVHAALEPYRAFIDGRAALETLDRRAIARAQKAFDAVVHAEPGFAAGHIGVAAAKLLAFETTRADEAPDRAALAVAEHHARHACGLAPSSGDAWSTLSVVLHRTGAPREALAAARKAIQLEPEEWRHHLRLAFVAAGAERLRAAERVLKLRPNLAAAHWLAATVFVARGALDVALDHVRAGCAGQDGSAPTFSAVGLHLLHGLILAASLQEDTARAALARELAFDGTPHIYANECVANAHYAIGVLDWRGQQLDAAGEHFALALGKLPGHTLAAIALSKLKPEVNGSTERSGAVGFNEALGRAAILSLDSRHDEAARVCEDAIRAGDAGAHEWVLPVEPLVNAAAHPQVWAPALALLRARWS